VHGIPEAVELFVAEALQTDVGLGCARVDEVHRRLLSLDVGEVLEIAGKRTTVATIKAAVLEDEGKHVIRIDGLTRTNASVKIGAKVIVKRAEVHLAQEVEFAAIMSRSHKISFGQGIENFVKRGLLNRPLRNGDSVIIPGIALMGGALPFKVIRTQPEGNVRVAETTRVSLRELPTDQWEDLSPEEVFKAFTDRLSDLMNEFESALINLEGPPGERARSISLKLSEIIWDLKSNQ
jgi:transitional endoplasmic reticulum ATPase